MKKCLLIINKTSGNSQKALNNKEMYDVLERQYDKVDTIYIEENSPVNIREVAKDYFALAVCGGDGTFNNAINATRGLCLELIYVPCGTLNDTANSLKLFSEFRSDNRKLRKIDIGEIDNTLFSYVAAAGSFTPIGYMTKNKLKQKIKIFAYLFEVLKQYKVHQIKARIDINENHYDDTFTLIMAINSKRCFGFNFNHLYDHKSGTAHLLLIKTPKKPFAYIKMFFPFFKAFFIGFRKEINRKNIKFIEFENAGIILENPTTFTIDGEKIDLKGKFDIKIHKQKMKLFVY